jgi:hypothetical protein
MQDAVHLVSIPGRTRSACEQGPSRFRLTARCTGTQRSSRYYGMRQRSRPCSLYEPAYCISRMQTSSYRKICEISGMRDRQTGLAVYLLFLERFLQASKLVNIISAVFLSMNRSSQLDLPLSKKSQSHLVVGAIMSNDKRRTSLDVKCSLAR